MRFSPRPPGGTGARPGSSKSTTACGASAGVIGVAEAPFEERLAAKFAPADTRALEAAYRRALRIAATTSQGLFVPMGFEFGARRRMDARRATR